MDTDFLFDKSKEPAPELVQQFLGPIAKLHQQLDEFLHEEIVVMDIMQPAAIHLITQSRKPR
jgi:hypothetical protein